MGISFARQFPFWRKKVFPENIILYALSGGIPRGAIVKILIGPRKNTQVRKVTVTDTAAKNFVRKTALGNRFVPVLRFFRLYGTQRRDPIAANQFERFVKNLRLLKPLTCILPSPLLMKNFDIAYPVITIMARLMTNDSIFFNL